MYYKYEFIKHDKFRRLQFHFLYFMRKIRSVKKGSPFIPSNYFHKAFLNVNGEIAPSGVRNEKISNAFKLFFEVFKKIDIAIKEEFYQLIIYSQNLKTFFEDDTIDNVKTLHINNLNRLLGNNSVLKNLMDALWDNLKTNVWEIDLHYSKFYGKLPSSKMCPFCGIKKMVDTELGKDDYDHLLYKAKYPLTAIFDKNIAPACSDCNRRFKLIDDILFNDEGRRKFKYPWSDKKEFERQNVLLDLNGSTHPEQDLNNYDGTWVINITPNDDYNKSWLSVYKINTRYVSHLNVDYKKWIIELVNAAQIDGNTADFLTFKQYIEKYKKTFERLDVEYPLKRAYYNFVEDNMSDNLLKYMEDIAI